MQRVQEATGPSRPTQTITGTSVPEVRGTATGTLHLRGHHSHERRVAWTDNTIDNEKLGRKSSKICCIYHKPKEFDQSSSEDSSSSSDSDDTGDEHESAANRSLKRKAKDKKVHKRPCDHESSPDSPHICTSHGKPYRSPNSQDADVGPAGDKNAYERGVK